jgi:hypothetical protein
MVGLAEFMDKGDAIIAQTHDPDGHRQIATRAIAYADVVGSG